MSGLRVLVSGMTAADPHQGGATWAVLQYVLGLRALGHDVYLVEPVAPQALRPAGAAHEGSINARYFMDMSERFDLVDRTALVLQGSRETVGLSYANLLKAATSADVLVNIAGMLTDDRLLESIPCRVYLDLDPAFTQLWHAVQGIDMGFQHHTDFATIGPAIGTAECEVPSCGLDWIATWQPVVLERWPVANGTHGGALTTVANWRGYGSIEHAGVSYGQKVHAWRAFMTLPTRTNQRIVVALGIDSGDVRDLEALAANGWELVDPAHVAATPDAYQGFIQGSKAEIGIAKSGYVASRTGWVSDRSICYLASGRPVLAQETGFSRFLPTGEGLLPFETLDQALDGIARFDADYARHARAARALAETYFDSDKVLSRLLARLGLA